MAGGYSHVCLYEILRKKGVYFKLRCGQNEIRIRSAHGSYSKIPANLEKLLIFVGTGSCQHYNKAGRRIFP